MTVTDDRYVIRELGKARLFNMRGSEQPTQQARS